MKNTDKTRSLPSFSWKVIHSLIIGNRIFGYYLRKGLIYTLDNMFVYKGRLYLTFRIPFAEPNTTLDAPQRRFAENLGTPCCIQRTFITPARNTSFVSVIFSEGWHLGDISVRHDRRALFKLSSFIRLILKIK